MADLTTQSTQTQSVQGSRRVVLVEVSSVGGTTSDTVSVHYLRIINNVYGAQYTVSTSAQFNNSRFNRIANVVVEPHVAIDPQIEESINKNRVVGIPRVAVFAGRLLYWKGLRMALAALAEPEAASWQLRVYGEGPDKEACVRLASRLGVSNRVAFLGKRPRTDVVRSIARADALLFPSMHDSAGWVVAEALTLGTPVVCLDRGGPATLVDDGSGIRVKVDNDVPKSLAVALSRIANSPPTAPSTRWSAERLPALLANWYQRRKTPVA